MVAVTHMFGSVQHRSLKQAILFILCINQIPLHRNPLLLDHQSFLLHTPVIGLHVSVCRSLASAGSLGVLLSIPLAVAPLLAS